MPADRRRYSGRCRFSAVCMLPGRYNGQFELCDCHAEVVATRRSRRGLEVVDEAARPATK